MSHIKAQYYESLVKLKVGGRSIFSTLVKIHLTLSVHRIPVCTWKLCHRGERGEEEEAQLQHRQAQQVRGLRWRRWLREEHKASFHNTTFSLLFAWRREGEIWKFRHAKLMAGFHTGILTNRTFWLLLKCIITHTFSSWVWANWIDVGYAHLRIISSIHMRL